MGANLTQKEKEKFVDQGYLIIKNKRAREFKKFLIKDLKKMALLILENHPATKRFSHKFKSATFSAIFDWCIQNEKNNEITKVFYELFPTSFSMVGAVGGPLFVGISKDLGITYPLPSTLPILRIDRPKESRYQTPAHQDYWYSMLSDNALTYWFPLLPITESMGHLFVLPKSHRKGILPIRQWTNENPFMLRDEISIEKLIPVNLKEDEVLVFSQHLIHQSGVNYSKKARLTLQIRHNDLCTLKKLTTSFTAKHSVYTTQAQQDWLVKSGLTGCVHATR